MNEDTPSNRRRFGRRPVRAAVQVTVLREGGAARYRVQMLDVSRGGALLRSVRRLALGDRVYLHDAPDGRAAPDRARVVWLSRDGDGWQVGIAADAHTAEGRGVSPVIVPIRRGVVIGDVPAPPPTARRIGRLPFGACCGAAQHATADAMTGGDAPPTDRAGRSLPADGRAASGVRLHTRMPLVRATYASVIRQREAARLIDGAANPSPVRLSTRC